MKATGLMSYLDYRKAFDTVPHTRLIEKVKAMGINGKLFSWLEQFSLDRAMRVQVNGSFSDWFKVLSGVPQGLVIAVYHLCTRFTTVGRKQYNDVCR